MQLLYSGLARTARLLNISHLRSVKTEKFKFELEKFVQLIQIARKDPNHRGKTQQHP